MDDANIQPYTTEHIPIQGRKSHSRKSSFLDIGGTGSINNFTSSVQRSVNYLSTSFDSKHALSPRLNELEDTIDESALENEDVYPDLNGVHYGSIEANSSENNQAHSILQVSSSPYKNQAHHTPGTCPDVVMIKSDTSEEIIKQISIKSTPAQTIFNSINVLIGLGILSIPLALHLSGWILGVICLSFAAVSTKQTAILLGKILYKYPNLKTYHDIGVHCYGDGIGFLILIIFTLDLFGAGISMILLFSDSFYALSPEFFSKFSLKLAITTLLVLLNLLPLRLLSFLSLLGIISTTATCLLIAMAGCIKTSSPGSLLFPMETNLYPKSIVDFFFALGLFMAPWGGHATFPEIYNDQLKPQKYGSCMKYSFSFSYMVDLMTGVLGFLMFGEFVDDEITRNIIVTKGYPPWISTGIVVLMGILPISKLPLISRPIVTILDSRFGDSKLQRLINRIILSSVFLTSSILLTNFGKVMSLLGSLICFTVCLTLPAMYYLSTFKTELGFLERFIWQVVIAIGIIGAIGGTVAVIVR